MRGHTKGMGAAVLVCVFLAPARLPATLANDLCAPGADPCVVSTAVPVTTGSLIDLAGRELRVVPGGALDVGGGSMTIRAGRVSVASGGFIRARGSGAASGGIIIINAGDVTLAAAGSSGALDANGAPGGTITVNASGDLTLTGPFAVDARALALADEGGTVNLLARNATLAGQVRVLGGTESLGGDITVTVTGALTVSALLDAAGGDGGSIDLEAGAGGGAGDLVLAAGGTLRADATLAGGFGGTVDIAAGGDGVGSGRVTLDGVVTAIGKTGGEDVGGGSGGCIAVTASGPITGRRAASELTVEGGGPDGDGGEIELSNSVGAIEMHGSLDASSAGEQSNGGAVAVDAAGDAMLAGVVLVTGGDGGGGEVTVSSAAAGVLVPAGGRIDAGGLSGGAGGSICLETGGTVAGARAVVVEGRLAADGGVNGGGGGAIELIGGDAVRIAATGSVRAAGALGGGRGGAVSLAVDDGPALIDGPLVVAGGSPSGAGGVIAVDAGQRIVANALLDARGFGLGGEIGLAATGGVDVRRGAIVSSTTDSGGSIEIVSQGEVTLSDSLSADGVALPGGRIDVEGCLVTVCGLDSPMCPAGGTGVLSSRGPQGRNRITGRDSTAVLGSMRATENNGGRNELIYAGAPAPLVLGSVVPAAALIISDSVRPCPACGNEVIDPPETCDDGNQLDGDGCSAGCQVEAPIPGDANGDYVLALDDAGFLISEVFDGDGDSIGTVSGGAFAGAPGADANDDGHVTAADLSSILRLLGAP